jgi:3'-phosphoadenosine 5'-phosphosulfate (PAPS) 3'-phosphatase
LTPGHQPGLPEDTLEFAVNLSHRAGEVALRYFQQGVPVEQKADLSPVTVADREVEQLLRRGIEERFPGHGILGDWEKNSAKHDVSRLSAGCSTPSTARGPSSVGCRSGG